MVRRRRTGPRAAVVLVAGAALVTTLLVSPATAAEPARPAPSPVVVTAPVQLRVDQAGYLSSEAKVGYLMAPHSLPGARVDVVDLTGHRVGATTVTRRARWSAGYPEVYAVAMPSLRRPGRYRLQLRGTTVVSPIFAVESAADLWRPVLGDGVAFDALQRDGADVVPGPLHRQPSHVHDRSARVYAWPHFEPDSDVITDPDLTRVPGAGPVDVEGGWFDAGDYLKFVHSTAYADVLLYASERDLGAAAPPSLRAEARHGSDWLAKMWDRRHRVLYLQVGIGSGNEAGTFTGDHDLWRLPEADDGDTDPTDRYAAAHRPVFQAAPAGQPISPNLVGRTSAAFALAAQADARPHPSRAREELAEATSLYAMADTATPPTQLVTALPFAFYPEDSWHDDMELGATEIARAQQALHRPAGHYVAEAARWADAYLRTDAAGGDTFNLYDVSALAHADLAPLLAARMRPVGSAGLAVTSRRLVADLARQLDEAAARSRTDPFGAGVDDTAFDVDSHTLGLVATAAWYHGLTGSRRYDSLAAGLRGWVFGANAWGVSFMVGVGTTYPHCLQHQVANLSGRPGGTGPPPVGAVVNGPNGADLFTDGLDGLPDGGVSCPGRGVQAAVRPGRFDGSGSVFLDDARSWQTDEPALDMTGAAIIAAASQLGTDAALQR